MLERIFCMDMTSSNFAWPLQWDRRLVNQIGDSRSELGLGFSWTRNHDISRHLRYLQHHEATRVLMSTRFLLLAERGSLRGTNELRSVIIDSQSSCFLSHTRHNTFRSCLHRVLFGRFLSKPSLFSKTSAAIKSAWKLGEAPTVPASWQHFLRWLCTRGMHPLRPGNLGMAEIVAFFYQTLQEKFEPKPCFFLIYLILRYSNIDLNIILYH